MLNIPETIVVLGQAFAVRVEGDPHAALVPSDPDTFDAFGHCDRARQVITLRGPEGMSEAKAKEVLLHEVLHAVIGTGRIPPFMAEGAHGEDDEEAIVESLAPLLLQTMRANPDFVEAIMAPDEPRVTHLTVIEGGARHAD